MDEIEYLAAKEGIVGLYNREKEEKRIRATLRDEGYEEGKLEGIEEGKSIAFDNSIQIINLIKEGKSNEEISNMTDSSLEIIIKIRESL